MIGLVHGAFVLAVALPVLPGVHPRMASELRGPTVARQLEPPGFLALHYGVRTPISVADRARRVRRDARRLLLAVAVRLGQGERARRRGAVLARCPAAFTRRAAAAVPARRGASIVTREDHERQPRPSRHDASSSAFGVPERVPSRGAGAQPKHGATAENGTLSARPGPPVPVS